MVLSFPRRREPSQINKLDSRLRGDDDLFSVSLARTFHKLTRALASLLFAVARVAGVVVLALHSHSTKLQNTAAKFTRKGYAVVVRG